MQSRMDFRHDSRAWRTCTSSKRRGSASIMESYKALRSMARVSSCKSGASMLHSERSGKQPARNQ